MAHSAPGRRGGRPDGPGGSAAPSRPNGLCPRGGGKEGGRRAAPHSGSSRRYRPSGSSLHSQRPLPQREGGRAAARARLPFHLSPHRRGKAHARRPRPTGTAAPCAAAELRGVVSVSPRFPAALGSAPAPPRSPQVRSGSPPPQPSRAHRQAITGLNLHLRRAGRESEHMISQLG